jgi:hypothetical protein
MRPHATKKLKRPLLVATAKIGGKLHGLLLEGRTVKIKKKKVVRAPVERSGGHMSLAMHLATIFIKKNQKAKKIILSRAVYACVSSGTYVIHLIYLVCLATSYQHMRPKLLAYAASSY